MRAGIISGQVPGQLPREAPGTRVGVALARILLCGGLCCAGPAVRAEEPLYLRIRANPEARLDAGAGAMTGTMNGPPAAGPPRESAWERSDRRARIAIASVCSGCLAPRSTLRAFMPSSVAEAPSSAAPPRDATADPTPDPPPDLSPLASTTGDP